MRYLGHLLRHIVYFNTYRRLKSCGHHVNLSRRGLIQRPDELTIGDNVFIGQGFVISARDMQIGNNIMIGPYFLAECDDHIYNRVGVTMYSVRKERNIKPIIIEDDVWIGGHVSILKGVKISEGCVVGAGSVVTKDLPPYTLCYGSPCKPQKMRFDDRKVLEYHLKEVNSKYKIEDIKEI